MRCGAFCFAADQPTAEAALRSAKRMAVFGSETRVIRTSHDGSIVSLAYGGSDLPAVHGWQSEHGQGECALLSSGREGLLASRDYCGTRPLYAGGSRRWVATDHRFFPGEKSEPLPRGATLSLATGDTKPSKRGSPRFDGTFEEAAERLASLIRESVKARVRGKKRVAVAFSGGLDSSIVAHCASSDTRVIACSVASEGSTDSTVARGAASVLGVELVAVKADARAVEKELLSLDLPFEPSPMDRSLWCVYSMASHAAMKADAEVVMLGQLADEMFGGYSKYERALAREGEAAAGAMMAGDVDECGMRGLVRDEAACRRWCEPRFPFAQREIAILGESLPVAFKIRKGVRKAVLREAAVLLGLPGEIAAKPKKAAQYSSGVLKLLG